MKTLFAGIAILLTFQITNSERCQPKPIIKTITEKNCSSDLNLLDINQWEFYSETEQQFVLNGPTTFHASNEGLVFYGTSPRFGGRISTKTPLCLGGTTIYVTWKVSGTDDFNNYAISLYYDKNIPAPQVDSKMDFNDVTTGHSYKGSLLIQNDVWYFSRIHIDDLRASCITSINNYDDAGGKILRTDHSELKLPAGWLAVRAGDTYSGAETYVTVKQFRVVSELLVKP